MEGRVSYLEDAGWGEAMPGQRVTMTAERLTLRDQFAVAALVRATGDYPKDLARDAYAIADAMLAERERGK